MRGIWLVFIVACIASMVALRADGALADDSALCRSAISSTEASLRIPDAFLSAIARVESGRLDRQTGALVAWPWTINAEGQGSFFATKAEAVAAVRALQSRGVRSIDVGCMQVNLMHHPEAFGSLEQAFDPAENTAFAGRLLLSLFAQTRAWPRAAAAYHSQTPTVGAVYQKRVLAEWGTPEDDARDRARPSIDSLPDNPAPGRGAIPARMAALPVPAPLASPAGAAFGRVGAFTTQAAPAVSSLASTGRGLAAYRAMPTLLAVRWARRPG